MAFSAIALDATRRAGKTSASISLQSVIDGESKIAVVACRDRARHVVGHVVYDTRLVPKRL
jgi:hypothetical protein